MLSTHAELNQENYKKSAHEHNGLGLDSTQYLAYRDIPKLLKKHLPNTSNTKTLRILDFGCGTGLSMEVIQRAADGANLQTELVGIDLNEENIKLAEQRIQKGRFYKVDESSSLSFLGKFDVVVCIFVLVENNEKNMTNLLNSMHSLLNDSGIAIVVNGSSSVYKRVNKWYTFNNDFEENEQDKETGKFKDDQPIKVQVYASGEKKSSFTFFDFFHSGAQYKKCYSSTGFQLLETHKPLGTNTDGITWKDETKVSPYKVHVLRKDPNFTNENTNTSTLLKLIKQ